jgi:hypothetical protein
MEIPGVYYTELFSPVAMDMTMHSTIAVALYQEEEGWCTGQLKCSTFEAAFLKADLDSKNPVYVEWPKGMVELGFITEEEWKEYYILLK